MAQELRAKHALSNVAGFDLIDSNAGTLKLGGKYKDKVTGKIYSIRFPSLEFESELNEQTLASNKSNAAQQLLTINLVNLVSTDNFVIPKCNIVTANVGNKSIYGIAFEEVPDLTLAKDLDWVKDEERFALLYVVNVWIGNLDFLETNPGNFGFDQQNHFVALDFVRSVNLPRNLNNELELKFNALDGMLDPNKYPKASQYFKKLSAATIKSAIQRIISIPDQEIINLCSGDGLGTAQEKEQLAVSLIRCKYAFAAKYDLLPTYLNKYSHFKDIANFVLLTYLYKPNEKDTAANGYYGQLKNHGLEHNGRVAELIVVFHELYFKYSKDSQYLIEDEELFEMLKIGGLFHDFGRTSDYGDDNPASEERSANKAYAFLISLGFDKTKALIIKEAMINKDNFDDAGNFNYTKISQYDPATQKLIENCAILLHDADCLDVLRADDWRFDPKYLLFYKKHAKENWTAHKELLRVVEETKKTQKNMGDSPQSFSYHETHKIPYWKEVSGNQVQLEEKIDINESGNFNLEQKRKIVSSLTPFTDIHTLFNEDQVLKPYLDDEFISIRALSESEANKTNLDPRYLVRPKRVFSNNIPVPPITSPIQPDELPYYSQLKSDNSEEILNDIHGEEVLTFKGNADISPTDLKQIGGFHPRIVVTGNNPSKKIMDVTAHREMGFHSSGMTSHTIDVTTAKKFLIPSGISSKSIQLHKWNKEGSGFVYCFILQGMIGDRIHLLNGDNEYEYSALGGASFSAMIGYRFVGLGGKFQGDIKIRRSAIEKYGLKFIQEMCQCLLENGEAAYIPPLIVKRQIGINGLFQKFGGKIIELRNASSQMNNDIVIKLDNGKEIKLNETCYHKITTFSKDTTYEDLVNFFKACPPSMWQEIIKYLGLPYIQQILADSPTLKLFLEGLLPIFSSATNQYELLLENFGNDFIKQFFYNYSNLESLFMMQQQPEKCLDIIEKKLTMKFLIKYIQLNKEKSFGLTKYLPLNQSRSLKNLIAKLNSLSVLLPDGPIFDHIIRLIQYSASINGCVEGLKILIELLKNNNADVLFGQIQDVEAWCLTCCTKFYDLFDEKMYYLVIPESQFVNRKVSLPFKYLSQITPCRLTINQPSLFYLHLNPETGQFETKSVQKSELNLENHADASHFTLVNHIQIDPKLQEKILATLLRDSGSFERVINKYKNIKEFLPKLQNFKKEDQKIIIALYINNKISKQQIQQLIDKQAEKNEIEMELLKILYRYCFIIPKSIYIPHNYAIKITEIIFDPNKRTVKNIATVSELSEETFLREMLKEILLSIYNEMSDDNQVIFCHEFSIHLHSSNVRSWINRTFINLIGRKVHQLQDWNKQIAFLNRCIPNELSKAELILELFLTSRLVDVEDGFSEICQYFWLKMSENQRIDTFIKILNMEIIYYECGGFDRIFKVSNDNFNFFINFVLTKQTSVSQDFFKKVIIEYKGKRMLYLIAAVFKNITDQQQKADWVKFVYENCFDIICSGQFQTYLNPQQNLEFINILFSLVLPPSESVLKEKLQQIMVNHEITKQVFLVLKLISTNIVAAEELTKMTASTAIGAVVTMLSASYDVLTKKPEMRTVVKNTCLDPNNMKLEVIREFSDNDLITYVQTVFAQLAQNCSQRYQLFRNIQSRYSVVMHLMEIILPNHNIRWLSADKFSYSLIYELLALDNQNRINFVKYFFSGSFAAQQDNFFEVLRGFTCVFQIKFCTDVYQCLAPGDRGLFIQKLFGDNGVPSEQRLSFAAKLYSSLDDKHKKSFLDGYLNGLSENDYLLVTKNIFTSLQNIQDKAMLIRDIYPLQNSTNGVRRKHCQVMYFDIIKNETISINDKATFIAMIIAFKIFNNRIMMQLIIEKIKNSEIIPLINAIYKISNDEIKENLVAWVFGKIPDANAESLVKQVWAITPAKNQGSYFTYFYSGLELKSQEKLLQIFTCKHNDNNHIEVDEKFWKEVYILLQDHTSKTPAKYSPRFHSATTTSSSSSSMKPLHEEFAQQIKNLFRIDLAQQPKTLSSSSSSESLSSFKGLHQ